MGGGRVPPVGGSHRNVSPSEPLLLGPSARRELPRAANGRARKGIGRSCLDGSLGILIVPNQSCTAASLRLLPVDNSRGMQSQSYYPTGDGLLRQSYHC